MVKRSVLMVEGRSPKSIASSSDLPDTIKDTLSEQAQEVFVAALSEAVEVNPNGEPGACFGAAWDAVNESFDKSPDGEWVRKESSQQSGSMQIIEGYIYEMSVVDKLVKGGHAVATKAKSVASSVASFARHAVETFKSKWNRFLKERRKLKHAEMLHDYITKIDQTLTARISYGSEQFAAKVYSQTESADLSELAKLITKVAKDGVPGAAKHYEVAPAVFDKDVIEAVVGSLIFTVISFYGFEIETEQAA